MHASRKTRQFPILENVEIQKYPTPYEMRFSMGSFVLYRQHGSNSPLWPGVVCPDDVAPQDFLDTNPRTYVHLVLLVGEKLNFCWALTSELHDFDPSIPFTDEETVENTPGLGEAFAMCNVAIEEDLGLDHWRWRVETETTALYSDSETLRAESSPCSSDGFDHSEIQLAIQQSRLDFDEANKHAFSSSSTAPRSIKQRDKVVIILDSDDDDDDQGPRLAQPYKPYRAAVTAPYTQRHTNQSAKIPRAPRQEDPFRSSSVDHGLNGSSHVFRSSNSPAVSGNRQTLQFTPRTFTDGLDLKRLDEHSNVPKSDTIEGDIETSKTHVRVRVGPQHDERMLLKASVWDKPYFRESTAGIMYFSMDDDGMFELKHPSLADIDPDDFTYIAEYLESGQFGYVNPQGAEQENEAFSELVAAWTVAEVLGMADMMEHMIDKLQRMAPWDLWHVMLFACNVYTAAGISLPAQDRIKEMLAGNIAENYWIYIEDDYLSAEFVQRLKELPELDRDVTVRRAELLNDRI